MSMSTQAITAPMALDQVKTIDQAQAFWTRYVEKFQITEADEQEYQEFLKGYEKIPLPTLKAELKKEGISEERKHMLETMVFFEEATEEMLEMANLQAKAAKMK